MNNKKIKLVILILFIVTLFLSIIGVTFSYFQNTGTLTNNFQAGDYSTSATESFVSPSNWLPGDTTSKTVIVTNEGDITQGVRIKIEESWLDSSNNELPLEKDGVKAAIINFANPEDWERDGDYYYYKEALEPGESTSSLIESVTFNKDIVTEPVCTTTNGQTTCQNTYNGYENATYKLNIIIQTIQYEFMDPEWDEDAGTLYAVLRDEYRSNSRYAGLYTGEHQDSFDRPATKKIYYYTTQQDNATQGNILLDKTNVLFGGYCWQMIRTTDTGGVKMIYNGIPVDGKCLNTRSNINGLVQGSLTTNNMNATYAYGSDFTYDLTNGTFKIDGTIKENTNYSNDKSVIGYYTCKNTNKDATCTTLYYIQEENPSNVNFPYVYPFTINSVNYAQIGTTPYSSQSQSPAYVGYMYNKSYDYKKLIVTRSKTYTQRLTLLPNTSLSTTYYYADSVDMGNTNTNKYTLIDPYKVNSSSDYANLIGKYTFRNTSATYSSGNVFYIEAISGSTMYYKELNTRSIYTDYYYGDTYDYGETTAGMYTINNATQWSNGIDVTGKYVTSGANNTSIYYVVEMLGDMIFCQVLSEGNKLKYNEQMVFGESLTDNGDNTYTLNNTIISTQSNYYSDYASYKDKYTCGDSALTCTSPRYITSNGSNHYVYLNARNKLLISKTRNGLTLTDTLVVNIEELSKNRLNYVDYKYTCGDLSRTCTNSTLQYITAFTETSYNYADNYYMGASVTWDGSKYIINNSLEIESVTNITDIITHHYTCPTIATRECTEVAYVYYYSGTGDMYYILLKNGVENPLILLNEMLYDNNVNVKDSAIKRLVDKWYQTNLLSYDPYLEETIYCNNRSISVMGGWKDDGGRPNQNINFEDQSYRSDLSCTNETDKFSVSNNKAKLKYKVGLISKPEMYIISNTTFRKTNTTYWTSSPAIFSDHYSYVNSIDSSGLLSSTFIANNGGVRPVISLASGIIPDSGTGTMADPYVIDTSGI